MGKLSNNSNHNNSVCKLPSEENNQADYGFVENFRRLFDWRDRLQKMRAEIEEKEYTTKYTFFYPELAFYMQQFIINVQFLKSCLHQ